MYQTSCSMKKIEEYFSNNLSMSLTYWNILKFYFFLKSNYSVIFYKKCYTLNENKKDIIPFSRTKVSKYINIYIYKYRIITLYFFQVGIILVASGIWILTDLIQIKKTEYWLKYRYEYKK